MMKNHRHFLSSASYTTLKVAAMATLPLIAGLVILSSTTLHADAASTCGSSGGWAINGTAPSSGECKLGNFDPALNDGKMNNVGSIVINNEEVTVKGNFNSVTAGTKVEKEPSKGWNSLNDNDFLQPDGTEGGTKIEGSGKSASDIHNDFNDWRDQIKNGPAVGSVRVGGREKITAKDQISGSNIVVNVYKTDAFKSGVTGGGQVPDGSLPSGWKISAGDGYYAPDYSIQKNSSGKDEMTANVNSIGLNLGKVENGGTMNINIDGDLDARVKQGKIFMADGKDTKLNWNHEGTTTIDLSAEEYTNPSKDYIILAVTEPTSDPKSYPLKITLPDGSVHTIRVTKPDGTLDATATAANIEAYNQYLVSVVRTGSQGWLLNQTQYDTLVNKALTYDPSDPPSIIPETKYYKVKDKSYLNVPDELLLKNGSQWNDVATNVLMSGTNGAVITMNANQSKINLTGGIGIISKGAGGGYKINENNALSVAGQDATVLVQGATGLNNGDILSGQTAVRIINGGGKNADGNTGVNINGEIYVNNGKLTGSTGMYVDGGRTDGQEGVILNNGIITGSSTGVVLTNDNSYNVGNDKTTIETISTNNNAIHFTNEDQAIINGGYTGISITDHAKRDVDNKGTINTQYGDGIFINNENASFENMDGATIYIGREAQNAPGQTTNDTSVDNGAGIASYEGNAYNRAGAKIILGSLTSGSVGMQQGRGKYDSEVINSGIIDMKEGWDSNALNTLRNTNFGMKAIGNGLETPSGSDPIRILRNEGTINVNGINTIGLGVFDVAINSTGGYDNLGGAFAEVTKDGIINVGESFKGKVTIDGRTQDVFFRNYGIYSDGDKASVKMAGTINMTGYGVVGVHARMGSNIHIEDTGKIEATMDDGIQYEINGYNEYGRPIYKLDSNGNRIPVLDENGNTITAPTDANQVGFYIYGRSSDSKQSSTVTNLAHDLKINTQSSTLFLIEAGAEFIGQGLSLTTTENAKYSTLIVGMGPNRGRDGQFITDKIDPATGQVYVTKVITKDAKLSLNAEGSMGIFIGGGAQGQISEDGSTTPTQILLNAKNSVGGAVDGRYQLIDGSYLTSGGKYVEWDGSDPTNRPATVLTNYADVRTGSTNMGSGEDVTGFISRYGGLLVNKGNIELMLGDHNTGVHVLEHGRLENYKDIKIGSGIGIHVEGESGQVKAASVTNQANIYVDNGRAGVLLDNNAYLYWNGIGDTVTTNGTANGFELAAAYTDELGRDHTAAVGVSIGVNKIEVKGSGNGVENGAETQYISFDGTEIDVSGKSSGIRTATNIDEYVRDKEGKATSTQSIAIINASADAIGYDFANAKDKGGADTLLTNDAKINSGITINGSDNVIGIRTATTGTAINYGTVNMLSNANNIGWQTGYANIVVNRGTLTSQSTALKTVVDLSNRDNIKSAIANQSQGVEFYNETIIHAVDDTHMAVRGSAYNDKFYFTTSSSDTRGLLDAGDGSDYLLWNGGVWAGGFNMGAGQDNKAIIDGSNGSGGINGVDMSQFNHAQGSSGSGDILTFISMGSRLNNPNDTTSHPIQIGSFNQDNIANGTNVGFQWEQMEFKNTNAAISGTIKLDGKSEFSVDGSSTIYAGRGRKSTVEGGESLKFDLSGTIDMTDASTTDYSRTSANFKDTFTIKGDLIGTHGKVMMDTWLGTDRNWQNIAPSDQLIIDGGHVSGTTSLVINGYGERGPGALTWYDGIKVVDAKNGATTTNDAFVIDPNSKLYCGVSGELCGHGQATPDGKGAIMVQGSAFVYRLEKGSPGTSWPGVVTDVYRDGYWSNDWYLRSGAYHPFYKSTIPLYEAYAGVINQINRLPTLQQRVGNRKWITADNLALTSLAAKVGRGSEPGQTDLSIVDPATLSDQIEGFWVRWQGDHSHTDLRRTFSGADHDLNYMTFQMGADFRINKETADDIWIAGVGMHYKTGKSKVKGSIYGSGELKPDGFGVDATLTWYGKHGAYMDLQAAITAYQTDIESYMTKLDGIDNAKATGYALSAEVGQKFALTNDWAMTPQIQLQWLKTDYDSFEDKMKAEISIEDGGESLITRLGLATSKDKEWKSDKGDQRRLFGYGIANVYYDPLGGDARTRIAELDVHYGEEPWQAGLGIGGTYNWADDKYSLYGELEVRSGLTSFGDNYGYGGTFGFRRSF